MRITTSIRRAPPSFYARIRTYWPGVPDGSLVADYAGMRPKLTGPGEPAADFMIEGPARHGIEGAGQSVRHRIAGLTSSLALADEVMEALSGKECEAVFRETTRPPKSLLSRGLISLIDVAAHHRFAIGLGVGHPRAAACRAQRASRSIASADLPKCPARWKSRRIPWWNHGRLDKPSIPVRLRQSLRGAGSDHPADRAGPVRSRSCRRRCIRRPSSRDRRKRLEFRNSAARRVQPNNRSSSREKICVGAFGQNERQSSTALEPARLPIGKYRPSHIRTRKDGPPPA